MKNKLFDINKYAENLSNIIYLNTKLFLNKICSYCKNKNTLHLSYIEIIK